MLLPKKGNQGKGYFFDVTDDQIKEHLTRSPKDIFQWLESTNKFVNLVQTEQEKHKSRLAKVI
jgi:hypothetical protein